MPNTEEILPDRFPIAIERKVLRSVSSVFTDIVWSVDISTHPYEKSDIFAHLCMVKSRVEAKKKLNVALPSVTAFVKNWNWKKKKKKRLGKGSVFKTYQKECFWGKKGWKIHPHSLLFGQGGGFLLCQIVNTFTVRILNKNCCSVYGNCFQP